MNQKILLIALGTVLSVSNMLGQAITFAAEKGELLFADGTEFRNSDNSIDLRGNVTVWAGLTQGSNLTSFTSGINSFKTSGDLTSLNNTLGLISWEAVPTASGLFANSRDFNLNAKVGSVGDSPFFLFTTSDSFDNLTPSDEIGLVGSSIQVIELATQIITFNGSSSWDIEYLGSLGSLTMQAVPEPSSFALIAGCFGLALAVVRRRSRCA